MNQLKFGLSQLNKHAPLWLVNTASVLAVLVVAKHHLITELPITNETIKDTIIVWTDYTLDTAQAILAIAVIFLGEKNK